MITADDINSRFIGVRNAISQLLLSNAHNHRAIYRLFGHGFFFALGSYNERDTPT